MSNYILEEVCNIREKAVEWLEGYTKLEPANVDAKELGEIADVVKDLFEAEKYAREACYYKAVTEAMHNSHDEDLDMAHMPVHISERMYNSGED